MIIKNTKIRTKFISRIARLSITTSKQHSRWLANRLRIRKHKNRQKT